MVKEKFYITTSILYSNAKPHIGFALELLQADVLARWHRLLGKDVYFLTGTDEHGVKVYDKAVEQGKEPQAWVDEVADSVQALIDKLHISNTDFIRTTDQKRHWPTAQKVWEQLTTNGDIELGHYSGYYCVNDEAYITKTEAESEEYANKKVIQLEEDNYMFKLGKYVEQLKGFLNTEGRILPAHRAKEMLNFIDSGLNDISFSRPTEKLSWGVPVPGDDSQVMYVWPDALINYISAIGYSDDEAMFKKYWPADVHVIGKDILRFHALFWPAILTSINEALPKQILVHGHILSGGQKMSKSLGNVVDPIELIDKWGADAVRYYLLREIPTLGDGDYSEERFKEAYLELANKLGNLLQRVVVFAHQHHNGLVPPKNPNSKDSLGWHGSNLSELAENFVRLNLSGAMDVIFSDSIKFNNDVMAEHKPWELVKNNPTQAGHVIYAVLENLRLLSIALYPFLPATSDRIRKQLGLEPIDPDNFDFDKETKWGGLTEGHQLGQSEILFPKF